MEKRQQIKEQISKLNSYKGQLLKIQDELEKKLDMDNYADVCDAVATLTTHISIIVKKLKNAIPKDTE